MFRLPVKKEYVVYCPLQDPAIDLEKSNVGLYAKTLDKQYLSFIEGETPVEFIIRPLTTTEQSIAAPYDDEFSLLYSESIRIQSMLDKADELSPEELASIAGKQPTALKGDAYRSLHIADIARLDSGLLGAKHLWSGETELLEIKDGSRINRDVLDMFGIELVSWLGRCIKQVSSIPFHSGNK
jgi:hypothetical protein